MPHGYATVRDRIVRALGPDLVVPVTTESWEDRITPLLAELEQKGLRKRSYSLENQRVQLIGDDDLLLQSLGAKPGGDELAEPALFLYCFAHLKDASVLRRFKEFPDETPQRELEEPWAGECAQARVLIVLNASPKP